MVKGTGGSATGGTTTLGGRGGAVSNGGVAGGTGGSTASTSGSGGTTECTSGAHRCSNDTVQTCDTNGEWPATGTACTNVCRNNACTGQCKPNTNKCSGNSLFVCDGDGNWPVTGTACATGYSCNATQAECVCGLTTCGDGRCIDTTGDPLNCGACDRACPGRQCSAGACTCATQSASNLVSSAGFDGSATDWVNQGDADVALGKASLDSSSCASSGSLLLTSSLTMTTGFTPVFSSCFPVAAGTTYDLGGWIYQVGPSGYGAISVDFYDADCFHVITGVYNYAVPNDALFDTWQYVHRDGIVPPTGALSGTVSVMGGSSKAGSQGKAYFDSLYFAPSPGHF